jgi:hypothetical protein
MPRGVSGVPPPTEAEVISVYKLLQKFAGTLAMIFEAYPSVSTKSCRYDTNPDADFPAIVDQSAEFGAKLHGQPIRDRTLATVQQIIKDFRISPQLVDGGAFLALIAECMRESGVDFPSNFHDANMTVSFYQVRRDKNLCDSFKRFIDTQLLAYFVCVHCFIILCVVSFVPWSSSYLQPFVRHESWILVAKR